MVDFAIAGQRERGLGPLEAIREACLLRFPSDHDDDDGGAARRGAADARLSTGSECASHWLRDGGG